MANKQQRKQKRNQRRQKGRENGMVTTTLTSCPFPPQMRRTIQYTYAGVLTEGAAGAGAQVIFRGNDLYDPYYAAGGAQPMYFDQFCASGGPYTKFRVQAANIRVVANGLANTAMLFGVYASPSPNSVSGYTEAMEKPMGINTLVGQGSGFSKVVLQRKYFTDNVLGLARGHWKFDEYLAGAYNASPVTGWYFNVWLYTLAGTAGSVQLLVTIQYDVSFYSLTNTSVS